MEATNQKTGLLKELEQRIRRAEHPRELVVDVMLALQEQYGYLSDDALEEAARLLGMSLLELEELASFYDFIYRRPVGRFVIRVCDSVVCWLEEGEKLGEHLEARLGIRMGETTPDGLFTLLPVCCIGYCDMAPAMLVNRRVYGNLNQEKIDKILEELRTGDERKGLPR
ncbi:MAG: NADH-quinone oxidoreductase subunit NuoE [bacterium]